MKMAYSGALRITACKKRPQNYCFCIHQQTEAERIAKCPLKAIHYAIQVAELVCDLVADL